MDVQGADEAVIDGSVIERSPFAERAAAIVAHRYMTLTSLSVLFFLVTAGAFSSLGVVLPAMVTELGWNWSQAGIGYTLLGVSCGLTSLAPAVLIRAIGVRGTMAVGTVALASGFATLAMTHTVFAYLTGTVLVGTAFGLTTTVPAAYVLTGLFKRQTTVLGAYFTMGTLGGVAGPLLYIVIHEATTGWRGYWWFLLVAALLVGLFAVATTPAKPIVAKTARTERDEGRSVLGKMLAAWGRPGIRRALAAPQYYVIVGGYTMYLLVNTTAHGFAVEHLTERGLDANAAAEMLSLEALIGAAGSLAGGFIGERMSAKTMQIAALSAIAIAMVALTEAHGWWLMGLYALGGGLGVSLTFIASTMLVLNYFGRLANLELYSLMCLISTTAAAGPAIGGWARDRFGDFTGTFWGCTAATMAFLIASLFLKPPPTDPAEAEGNTHDH